MIKACIFDLDGTLTETLESLTFSVNETLKEMGLAPITSQQCQAFVGNGAKVLMEKALQESGETNKDRLDEAMEIYGRIFDQNCTYHVVPYEGIVELLQVLRDRGIKLAVLSNKPDKQAVYVTETVFGKEMFQWIQGQRENVPRKPDPQAPAMDWYGDIVALGTTTEETAYIGDSEVDIATGKAAEMRTIGVSWGFREKEVLVSAGATRIVDHPAEILSMIE